MAQAESNNIKACAFPSIHLPLTREASVMAIFEGLLSFCNCCENGSIRCNGRSKQGKDALACVPKVSQGCETNKAHTDAHPTKSEWDSANAKPYKHTDDCSTKSD